MANDYSIPSPEPEWVRIVNLLGAAEFHWHFAQGLKSLDSEHYIPGVLSLLAGIEASIRFTLYKLNAEAFPFEGDLGPVLSNPLLRKAGDAGLPVRLLAFPDEPDFLKELGANKPGVRLVRVRNDLAHGNIQSYINRELGDDNAFFTPECLRPLAHDLQVVAVRWAEGLAKFRKSVE